MPPLLNDLKPHVFALAIGGGGGVLALGLPAAALIGSSLAVAMAAIGLALGYDPAYVAIHHFARILMLVVIIPISLRRFDP